MRKFHSLPGLLTGLLLMVLSVTAVIDNDLARRLSHDLLSPGIVSNDPVCQLGNTDFTGSRNDR